MEIVLRRILEIETIPNKRKENITVRKVHEIVKFSEACTRLTNVQPRYLAASRIIQCARLHTGWSIVRRKLRKRKLAGVTVTGADVGHVLPSLRFCNQ